jgi:uncharacterized protein (TIGR03118 family)
MNALRGSGGLRSLASVTLLALAGCGGGYGGGSSALPNAVSVSANPSTIVAGQSTSLSWSSLGSTCVASGAWSGTLAGTGTQTVTPSASGLQTYSIVCSGGGYMELNSSTQVTVNAASAFSSTLLVADTTGTVALRTDANLVNPWGIVAAATSPMWVANWGTNTSTLYGGDGIPRALIMSFLDAGFRPTGIVANATAADFAVTNGVTTAGATFIFDGDAGKIAGWNPTVDATHAVTAFTAADGAVYRGLALARNAGQQFLYAADFRNRKIDVFNRTFTKQTTSATAFTFNDPAVPAAYSPFNIWPVTTSPGTTLLVVAYAQQTAAGSSGWVNGAGLGYVSIFDTNGQLQRQLVAAGGRLNAPWGIALAPGNFGTLSGALLIGNFGDGKINGYDLATGRYLGTIASSTGTAFAAPGLWGLYFGNDANNQPHGTLYYAAGVNNQANGNYGRIDLGSTPPVIGAAPTATIVVPASPLTGTVTLTSVPTSNSGAAIAKVDFYHSGSTLIGTATASPYTFAWNTTTVTNGTYAVRAVATDLNGNVGSSAAVNATVSN